MTMLVLSILCFLVIALGIVAIALGLGIRHPVRSAIALTMGGLVVLGGAMLFYESLEHRAQEARIDKTIESLATYVDLRAEWLKTHLHPVKKAGSRKPELGQSPGRTSGGR